MAMVPSASGLSTKVVPPPGGNSNLKNVGTTGYRLALERIRTFAKSLEKACHHGICVCRSMYRVPPRTWEPHREGRLMGWSGRVPAPRASKAGEWVHFKEHAHVRQKNRSDRRDRHRYRQELVSYCWPRQAGRDHSAAEMVA